MNIAFPALMVFLLLLPGIIFTIAFYNMDNEPLSFVPLTYKAVFSLFATFLLHLVWFWIIGSITSYQINLTKILIFISGAQSQLYSETINSIRNSEIKNIILYLLSIYTFSAISGKFTNFIVIRFKLDRFKELRFDNPWYYLFKGYELDNIEPDGVIISAVMEVAGQGYLYQGYLDSFYLDKEGNIDRMILTGASRRKIESDKNINDGNSVDSRFYRVDGDYFVIKYLQIKNLNVQFLKLQLEDPEK